MSARGERARRCVWLGGAASGACLAALLVATAAAAQDEPSPPRLAVVPAAPMSPNGHAGRVRLELVVEADGHVSAANVVESTSPDLDAPAVALARALVFQPARAGGNAVAARVRYEVTFVERATAPGTGDAKPVPPIMQPRASASGSATPVSPSPAPPGEQSVQVTGPARASPVPNRVSFTAEEARRAAGTEGDALKVVQSLPGVARAPLGSGQLVVWGAAPSDTLVYVDGVPVPALYHGGGLRGTVNADLVRRIDLVPGGYGAAHGRGLGGLVDVETRDLRDGAHGSVAADTLDGSALAEASLGDRAKIAVAGRYGWLDRVLGATTYPDVGDYFPIPRYRDLSVKGTLALREDESLDAVYLASADDLTRTVPSSDPAAVRSESTSSSYQRAYLRYRRVHPDGASVTVTPFFGYDTQSLVQSFGDVPARLDVSTWRYGVRGEERTRALGPVVLATGIDVLGSVSSLSRDGSLALPPREGDVTVFGQPPGGNVSANQWHTHILDAAPYAFADVSLGRRVTVTPGIRADAFLVDVDRTTPRLGSIPAIGDAHLYGTLDPRLAARADVTPRLALSAAAGVYHQPPAAEDLSAVFGTPSLGPSSATQYTAGEHLAITRALSFDATGYYESLDSLAVRSRLPTPKLARALIPDGLGRSYGIQLVVRHEMSHGFFGWASWTVGRSERQYLGDASWRLFDFDQTHVATVVVGKEILGFTVGARFRYSTGYPRTPVAFALYDARGDQYQPVFGPQNSTRLPDFYQLDLRVDRTFPFGATKLDLYVEMQNVTFHKNDEELVYTYDFRRAGYVTGLPTLAVAGARWKL